jgi:hypothetical protein
MIVAGYQENLGATAAQEAAGFFKAAGQAAGSAVLERAGGKLRAAQAGGAPAPAATDNTLRNVAIGGVAIVGLVVLISKMGGRKTASNPSKYRGTSGCRKCPHWLT